MIYPSNSDGNEMASMVDKAYFIIHNMIFLRMFGGVGG
jgi:hypothetical protein